MKIGTMWKDVTVALFSQAATECYPSERRAIPIRLHGALHWEQENCSGCGLCARDCPAEALEVAVIDRKAKRFVFTYHLDRCTFCAQCVHSCRQGCLEMSAAEWELAALNKQTFTIYCGDPNDIEEILANPTA